MYPIFSAVLCFPIFSCKSNILERDCISRIENGLRMVQDFELRAIAEALGVTTDWLLEAEEK